MAKTNYLKFWGTRGSCSVSGPEYQKFGGNTCSLEISYEDAHLIIDAGTGIRPLGDEIEKKKIKKVDLLLGHTHWDHIIGFPFFDPIYTPNVQITIWAPQSCGRSCKELFQDLLASEFFPVRLEEVKATIDFKTLHPKTPVSFGPITLDFHTTHHPGTAFCFKIKTPHQTIGYTTDNEFLQGYHGLISEIPATLLEPHLSLIHFLSDCDIIIHEGQYSSEEYLEKAGWGHSSIQNVAALIQMTKAPHWIGVHHDPRHTDTDLLRLEAGAKKILEINKIDTNVEWIGDGHQIYLK